MPDDLFQSNENPRVAIGANNPPPDSVIIPADTLPDFQKRFEDFAKGFDVWETRPELTEETAPRANDYLTGLLQLKKQADEARMVMTRPLRAKEKTINDAWKPFLSGFDRIEIAIGKKITAYKRVLAAAEAARQAEAKRKADLIAKQAREAAAEAAMAAKPSDAIAAEQRAATLKADAEAAEKEAKARKVQVASATGLARNSGLKTVRKAVIVDIKRAMLAFKDDPKMVALVLQLANEKMRHSDDKTIEIPGIEFKETQE